MLAVDYSGYKQIIHEITAFIQLSSGDVRNKKGEKIKLSSFPRNHNINISFTDY